MPLSWSDELGVAVDCNDDIFIKFNEIFTYYYARLLARDFRFNVYRVFLFQRCVELFGLITN